MSDAYGKNAEKLLMEILAITGLSGQETAVMACIVDHLRDAGAGDDMLRFDTAHKRIPFGGAIGNLALKLSGTVGGPRRMLMAHVDTVPLCEGARPVRRGNYVVPADKTTALGADDRTGTTAILAAALHLLREKPDHPPVTFLWTVQEEIGLYGAQFANLGMLGKPKMAFNFDGGATDKVVIGATGGYRMSMRIQGKASHAGAAPEKGVSAITIAALAIADLHQTGWLGKIVKPEGTGTSNVGVIHGGQATNVITPQVDVRAEARSHVPAFRQKIIAAIETAFQSAAKSVKSDEGAAGSVEIEGRLDYESYRLPDDSPVITAAETAIRALGGNPRRAISDGGLDANWISARGIPAVTLGCGQENPHTPLERLDRTEFLKSCHIAKHLATH